MVSAWGAVQAGELMAERAGDDSARLRVELLRMRFGARGFRALSAMEDFDFARRWITSTRTPGRSWHAFAN